jgi:hypothetical protein
MWMRAVLCALLCCLSACGGSDNPPAASTESPSSSPPPSTPPPTTNPPPGSGTAGPWPVTDLTVYAAAQSLNGTVIDASPDDAQNIWAVTSDALYVLRPGQTTFKRYTAADGLHVQTYTDPGTGQVTVSDITAMAGGHPNEVFVGYRGYEQTIPPPAPPSCCVANADFSDPRWHLGQADKITLVPDGSIQVRRYEFLCDITVNCWEERSARRMVFGHSGTAAGHLFIGFDHGVVHLFNDVFGDHTHVQTLWHLADGSNTARMGEHYGLALYPNGEMIDGTGYGIGSHEWDPDPRAWVNGRFVWAFTTYGPAEPYNSGEHDLIVPEGYREDNRGAAVTSDGTAWWVSLHTGLSSYNHSIAQGNTSLIRHYTDVTGLPASGLMDIAADPDGSLWIVDNNGRLLRFTPSTSTVQVWPGVSGARRVVVDTTVTPRALYVSMGSQGLAVIRAK